MILEPVKMDVIQSMIDTCDKSFHGLRDRAFFLTLLDTGIRARELVEINLQDFEYSGSRSGRANIAGGGRRKVLGILYEVEKSALELLGEVENGYKRIYVPVISESGARILAHTYISDSAGENQPPTPEHLTLDTFLPMATSSEILDILEILSEYYDRTLTNPQVRVYVRHLSDLHIFSLKHAARERINTSPFFPKVSKLRETAARFPAPEPDPLWDELQSLKRNFLTGGSLDLDTGSYLEQRLEAVQLYGYVHYPRRTLDHLQNDCQPNGYLNHKAEHKCCEWENSTN